MQFTPYDRSPSYDVHIPDTTKHTAYLYEYTVYIRSSFLHSVGRVGSQPKISPLLDPELPTVGVDSIHYQVAVINAWYIRIIKKLEPSQIKAGGNIGGKHKIGKQAKNSKISTVPLQQHNIVQFWYDIGKKTLPTYAVVGPKRSISLNSRLLFHGTLSRKVVVRSSEKVSVQRWRPHRILARFWRGLGPRWGQFSICLLPGKDYRDMYSYHFVVDFTIVYDFNWSGSDWLSCILYYTSYQVYD